MIDLDYIVREYLVHSGYQESFMALDFENSSKKVSNFEKDNLYDNLHFEKEFSNLSWRKDSNYQSNHMEVIEEYAFDLDKLRKYSADDGMMKEPELRKRTLSIMIDRINGI
jgi:hypothetical protein